MGTGSRRKGFMELTVVVAMAVLLHELHEQAHALAARWACAAWPSRDFNSWHLPSECASSIPTLAGPLFTYAVIWAGVCMARSASPEIRLRGIFLILMANPVARLFTATMGAGDEGLLVRSWLQLDRGPVVAACATAWVGALTIPPLVIAWRARPPGMPAWHYALLALAPMMVTGLVLFVAGNRLLAAGVLAEPVVAGAPALVWAVTLLSAILLGAVRAYFARAAHRSEPGVQLI